MDDEFKLCWKNFQDNIASGFQNLYDRGDLVDVTLACDGKLLQAHKFVLAICSPYFQEIFITNPCKHPTIFLKDVSFNIMCELLEFMYQGVVNVKHTELQSFMKVGQQLQIKGLATNSSNSPGSTTSEKSPSQAQQSDEGNNANEDAGTTNNCTIKNENPKSESTNKSTDGKNTPTTPPLPIINAPAISLFKNTGATSTPILHHGTKRHMDFPPDALPPYARKQFRRSHHVSHNSSNEGNDPTEAQLEQTNDDIFLPHFAMFEGRYDGKRENNEHHNSASTSAPTIRNPFGPAFNFDYTVYKNNAPSNSAEYPNELYMASDFSKNFGNHMEIPPNGANMVMLSSTSLLHGSCVFNRNNTVATQQGMKTYWLCKSYRISMCRARCITHQGRVISATGTHNHPPHMNGRNGGNNTNSNPNNQGSNVSGGGAGGGSGGGASAGGTFDNTPQPAKTANDNNNPSAGQQENQQTLTAPNENNLNIPPGLRGGNGSNNTNIFNHNIHGTNNDPQMHGGPDGPTPTQHLPPHSLPNLIGPHHGGGVHLHQNLMNNPNMMPLSGIPPMLTNSMHHHHSPQLRDHEANMDIVQMRSNESANSNSQSHHNVNTMPSPITIGNVTDNSNTNDKHVRRDDMHLTDDHHVLVHNAAMSPSELNVGVERNINHGDMRGREDHNHQHQHHQHNVHVIDSITISPTHRHSFKMESM